MIAEISGVHNEPAKLAFFLNINILVFIVDDNSESHAIVRVAGIQNIVSPITVRCTPTKKHLFRCLTY